MFKGSPAHVSALSGPATRAAIRPVIRGGRRRGRPCRRGFLSPFGYRHSLLGHPVPPRNSAPLTVGLPGTHLDPDGVSTFRTSESRPDWVPSLPRGPAVLSRPVRSLRPPLAPSPRGRPYHPGPRPIHRSCPLRGVIEGSLAFTRPTFPNAWLSPGWNRGPWAHSPGFAPQQARPAAHAGAGDGHRALARSHMTDIVGPPIHELTQDVRPRVARSDWT